MNSLYGLIGMHYIVHLKVGSAACSDHVQYQSENQTVKTTLIA